MAIIKLNKIRDPLKGLEKLLAELQAAIDDDDLDTARDLLDAYVSGDDDSEEDDE